MKREIPVRHISYILVEVHSNISINISSNIM